MRWEKPLLAIPVDRGADGKFHLNDGRLYDSDTRLDHPYDLNKGFDRALRSEEFREA